MGYKCCVPGCPTRGPKFKYFCVPFTNKPRWDMWLRACPFLRRYQAYQMENVRICALHFIPEHINERQRLTIDAIPMINLRKPPKQTEHSIFLEIAPTFSANEPYSFTIVGSAPKINNPSVDQKKPSDIQTTISSSSSELPPLVTHASQNQINPQSLTEQIAVEHLLPRGPHDISCETRHVMNVQQQNIEESLMVQQEERPVHLEPIVIIVDSQPSLSPCSPRNLESTTAAITATHSIQTTPVRTIKRKSRITSHVELTKRVCIDPNQNESLPSTTAAITATHSVQTTPVRTIKRKSRITSHVELTKRVRIDPNQNTPRKQKLRAGNDILKSKLRLLQIRYSKLKNKSKRYAPKTKMYLKKYNVLSTFGKLLVDSQLRLTGIEPKGRRYTNEEKIFALSLYKLSPKCYRFLRKHLALPCKSTINSILSNIPLRPGINDFIFQHLADAARDKPALDRQCTLLFDEMAIKKNLYFNINTGVIEGFEDIGSGKRTSNVADKALVFMLRGLFAPWKIPVAFYFARDGVKTFVLKNIIKEVASAIFKAGFIIRATVSDQGSANVAAIKSLISDTNVELLRSNRCAPDNICYSIGSNQLYHIYDVPHLLKCFRNNFQKKHLLIGNQRAKWEHIEMLYKVDGIGGRARSTKLTDKHINPTSYDKMKVKLAAQVFSRQVASSLEVYMKSLLFLQEHEYSIPNMDIESGLFTAEILLFVNNLFDSLNGFGYSGGKLQHALSLNSEHIEFWNTAMKRLNSMRFDSPNQRESYPLSLKHFVHDIKSIKHLWTDLRSIEGLKFLSLRRLNQDPLENFFGQVRAHGCLSTNPDCSHFVSAFKTLLINNITTGKSLYTNCANDDDKMLGTLKNFVNRQTYGSYIDYIQGNDTNFTENLIPPENVLQDKAVPYIAGAVCHSLIPLHCKDCDDCIKALLSEKNSTHSLIELREYSSNIDRLCYPSKNLSFTVWQCIYVVDRMLPSICSVHIYPDLISSLEQRIDTSWYGCVMHREAFLKAFWLFVIRMQTRQWCINLNRRIHNVDTRPKDAEMETLIRTRVTKGLSYRSVRRRST